MQNPFFRALIALAIAALLAVTTPQGAHAAKALLSPRAGLPQLCDPVDVPWGG